MNQHLQTILNFIQQAEHLSDDEKIALSKAAKNADKELEITSFKLERTEKVKRTTAILLEETIKELENKRKAVEAQNHELEVEAALERVRAIAMSMNKPDDMLDVCRIISDQLELLNVKEIRNVQTAIFYESKGTYMNYEYYAKHNKTIITETSFTNHKMHREFAAQMIKGKGEFFTTYISKTELPDWIAYQKTTNVFIDDYLYSAASLNYYWFSLGPVALGISTYEPLKEEETNLFRRFLKVFELSYRRYLDIEKAIAQAREAQIQLALERVRARTMAMQHSDELGETASVLFEQFDALGEVPERVAIEIVNEKEHVFEIWATQHGGKQLDLLLKCSLDEPHVMQKMYRTWKEQKRSITIDLQGKELEEYFEFLKDAGLPVEREIFGKRRVQNVATFSKGILTIITPEPRPQETIQLLERFAAVFDGTYTRFLDLQKAEAQAREAEIELALERVRAKTMAMQKQEDLLGVLDLLVEQFVKLGVNLQVANFSNGLPGGDWDLWIEVVADDGMIFNNYVHFPRVDHPYFHHVEKNIETFRNDGTNFFKDVFSKEEKHSWQDYVNTQTIYKDLTSEEIKQSIYDKPGYTWSMVILKDTWVSICRFNTIPFSDEEDALLRRFANAFGQAYTRFLDLQKAEAQAREAQIQLAMERVRARTMAMQHSNELSETALLLFEQVQSFGVALWSCGFNISEKGEKECISFITRGGKMLAPVKLPLTENPSMNLIYEFRERGVDFWHQEMTVEEIKELFSYIARQRNKNNPGDNQFLTGVTLPAFQIVHFVNFSHGNLMFITLEAHPEMHDIFKRLGNVFEQTYTRFLDLQKAEAQAREAQIELGLERVRARAMAMQKSDELSELVDTVFKELTKLDFALTWCIINIIDEPSMSNMVWAANPDIEKAPDSYHMKFEDYPFHHAMMKGWKERKTKYVYVLDGTEKKIYDKYLFNETEFRKVPEAAQAASSAMEKYVVSFSFSNFGGLQTVGDIPLSDANLDILSRFGKVFDLTYTRFNDLKQAEAQARESQIQLALERVRARTMAMQKSDELSEAVYVLFQQFKELGENPDQATIGIVNEDEKVIEYWVTMYGNPINKVFKFSLGEPNVTGKIYKAWKENKKSLMIDLSGDALTEFMTYRAGKGGAAINPDEKRRIINVAFFSKGLLNVQSNEERSEESIKLLERFASVFEQTYTRFLDLQKAEAQATEAQIQLALERVRARAMAMQSADELIEVANVMRHQMVELGQPGLDTAAVHLYSDNSEYFDSWYAFRQGDPVTGNLVTGKTRFKKDSCELLREIVDAYYSKRGDYSVEFTGIKLREWFALLGETVPDIKINLDNNFETGVGYFHMSDFSGGSLVMATIQPPTQEAMTLQKRCAAAFDLAYRRYLDLQKAEAQAREAKIEAALERVRSKAMAMHNSQDLADTIGVFYKELHSFSLTPRRCGVGLLDKEERVGELFTWNTTEKGESLELIGRLKMQGHPVLDKVYESWLTQTEYHPVLRGNEIKEYYKILRPQMAFPDYKHDDVQFGYFFFFPEGGVYAWTEKEMQENELQIYRRFTSVLSLTYKRYKDLQQAEAQAREATIEAALEKVRGKAMAMHNSNDLSVTASMVFTELRKLGIQSIRCGVGLFNKESQKTQLYSATSSPDGDSLSLVGWVIMAEHPVLEKIYESWLNNEEYYPELQGEQLRSYYQLLLRGLPIAMPDIDTGKKQYGHFFPFSIGCLNTWSDHPHSESEIKILRRFATIIDLTFRRYLELQKSEANARETVKQAAVDRIRADIASMRTISDLDRITPLIWNELSILGINFIRCGVFIMDDSQQLIHTFLSTPDGKAIAAFHLPYTTPGNIQKAISHWHDNESYIDHWNESDFTQFADMLVQQKALSSAQEYLKTIPHGGFYLHFLPFLQGMLYVGNTNQLNEEEISLIQAVADAFSTAYARYEDFNKLEEAKSKIETTFSELKATQHQLVQSEKMASLGELTAGIAHEIQNPLNFVNNFSEVNKEMLEELKAERLKPKAERDDQLEDEIINDVINNEGKINFHGKRADGIVKGMLQHSRKSEGKKEPTDINALCDEYLRLSFHGLRAKDKSFNADFKTDFDESIGKINIVPQDIGRVLLNLYNNAFYAVKPPNPLKGEQYKPLVSVRTRKINSPSGDGGIEITVTDNGNGIPQNIIDKIFQPFFTTKPTGQGTGLGLSLSYDIIKAHGGEINVETKEGKGSEFIIQLSVV